MILIWKQWNFFATSHGKSPVDDIGGTIKRLTGRAGFQRPCNNQTLSPEAVYQFCSKTIENIFNLIKRDTLNLLWDKLAYMNMEKQFLVYTATANYAQYYLMRLVISE